jgi:hypothetical protein
MGVVRRRQLAVHVPQHLRDARHRCSVLALGRDAVERTPAYQFVGRLSVSQPVPPCRLRLEHPTQRFAARRREAWQLGQLTAEGYHRAVNLPTVKVTTLPPASASLAGRSISWLRLGRAEVSAREEADLAEIADSPRWR